MLDLQTRIPTIMPRLLPLMEQVTDLTVHYNGPAVPERVFRSDSDGIAWLIEIAWLHIRKNWNAGTALPPAYGDGIMYHWSVLASGLVVQMHDPRRKRWHTGTAAGNNHSEGIYLPLGGNQQPTAAQLEGLAGLLALRMDANSITDRSRVKGHQEWKPTACPGPHLMRWLRHWRDNAPRLTRWKTTGPGAWVREGRGTQYPRAKIGDTPIALPLGWTFTSDDAAPVDGWLHIYQPAPFGFIRATQVVQV